MAKPPEAPGRDHPRAEGMEETKAAPEITNSPPASRNLPPPAPPLGSALVPVVVHLGGRPLSSLQFVFYRREWPSSLAPFCTAQEPFCGARFQQDARHGRRRIGLPSTEPGRWRSFHRPKP